MRPKTSFYDIVDYYKHFDNSLSRDFIQEFEDVVQRLVTFPKAGQPYLQTRAC
jgi:plasmid stabilization system protein ParE